MSTKSKTTNTPPKRVVQMRKYKDSIPPNIPQPESTAKIAPPEQIPMFNLTFKNAMGVSIVSVPDVQVHQLAQAIHHFFLERNIKSIFNHKKNAPDGEQVPKV